MAKASESRWSVRTGADGMPNGLPSVRTDRFRERPIGPLCGSARLRRDACPISMRHGIDDALSESARAFRIDAAPYRKSEFAMGAN